MDFRRVRVGEYLTALSGVLLIVSLFGTWYSAGSVDLTAWDTFAVLDALFLVLGLLAAAVLLITAAQGTGAIGMAGDSLLALVAVPVALVAVARFVNLPGAAEEVGAGRALFSYLGTLAVLGVAVGALVSMRDERLSKGDRLTDTTGAPVGAPADVEALPAPSRAASS